MTFEEILRQRRCKDVVCAWLLVGATLLAMNVVLTLAGAPSCRFAPAETTFFLTAATTMPVPGPIEAALRGSMLLAGVEKPVC
jgi:hypothetical protein